MKKQSLAASLVMITSIWSIYTAEAAFASGIRAAARRAVAMFGSRKATTTGALIGTSGAMLSSQAAQQENRKDPKRWIPILFPDGRKFFPMGPEGLLTEAYPEQVVCITPSKLGGAVRATTFQHIVNDTELNTLQEMVGKYRFKLVDGAIQVIKSALQYKISPPAVLLQPMPDETEGWLRLRDKKAVPSIVQQSRYWQGLTQHYSGLVASITRDASQPFQLFAQKFTQDAPGEALERAGKLKDAYTTISGYPTNVFMREDVDPAKLQDYGLYIRCNKGKTVCVAGTVE